MESNSIPDDSYDVSSDKHVAHDDALLATIGLVRPSRNRGSLIVTEGGYQPGRRVADAAYQNVQTKRVEWEALPLVEEGLDDVIAGVADEDRLDVPCTLADIVLAHDGGLSIPTFEECEALGFEIEGFKAFLKRAFITKHETLPVRTYDEDLREYVMLEQDTTYRDAAFPDAATFLLSLPLGERVSCMEQVLRRADKDQPFVLRTRVNANGRRTVYAAVSEVYAQHDADALALSMRDALGGRGLRGEVRYNASTTDILLDASFHASADTVGSNFAAGDAIQVGFRGRSNDAGHGSIRFDPFGRWNACLNCLIISDATGEGFRIIHKGDMAGLAADIEAGIESAWKVFEVFGARWGVLREKPVSSVKLHGQLYADVFDALAGLHEDKVIRIPGVSLKAMQRAATSDTAANSGSLAGIVDAITQAAWKELCEDIARDKAERLAGALVPVLARYAE